MAELLCTRINRICKRLKEKGLSARGLSVFLGYDEQSIRHWRDGERKMPLFALQKLAEKIGSSADEILKGTIQITGKKSLVNFSTTNYWRVTELREYPGLSLEEVKTVLEWKEKNPQWEP